MKEKKILALSAFCSVLAHLLLLSATFFIWIPGVSGNLPAPERLFYVKTLELPKLPAATSEMSESSEGRIRKLKFENPAESARQALSEHFETAAAEIKNLEPLDMMSPAPVPLEMAPPAPEPGAPSDLLKEKVSVNVRHVSSQPMPGQPVLLVTESGFTDEAHEIEAIPEAFREQMPAFTPGKNPGTDLGSQLGDSWEAGALSPFGLESAAEHESLDAFLNVSMLTYTNPVTLQNYFQISIYSSPRASELAVIPKEVLFLVDASLSIQRRRLFSFREGIKYAIQNLNPEDKFNIFVFKNEIVPFAVSSVSTRQEPVAHAMNFLDSLEASKQTDIYSALLETLNRKPARHPSYIVLLSDGKPSEGIVSSARLISEISRRNAQSRPIFAFSGGSRVNRFLLDFLAYPNRGWSEHAPYDSQIQERFSSFYDKIRDPLLTNLRYQMTALPGSEVYPRHLPDFYKGTVLTIYGTYKEERKFSLQILGDAEGKTKEFIFGYDLLKAQKGTREIARFWAFNKVYDLISRMTLSGPNAEDKKVIQQLVQDYELSIPYDFDKIL